MPSRPLHAPDELIARIVQRDSARSEATLQADVRQLLLSPQLNLRDRHIVNLEVPLTDGTRRRLDIEVGNAVIEVKRDLRRGNVLADAIKQLGGYLQQKTSELGARYVGIITDGKDWRLYNVASNDTRLTEVSSITASADKPDDLLIWLETILATVEDLQPSPEEIGRRLGVRSAAYSLDHQYLGQLYEEVKDNPEVRLKRNLWARLLRTAFGSPFADDASLFVDHTLLALQASIIAHAVIGLDLRETENRPVELTNGSSFANAQIRNVVEAGFFDWVFKAPQGVAFVRRLIQQLRRFSWNNVEHDVLKVLYESVIDSDTRKHLGEYYTPDWLAERMVAETIKDPLNQRVLDPACGSGTFLFHAIRHHLAAADALGLDNAAAISSVQNSVFGMDIHPVSVVLARVTYLLAIGSERLTGNRGNITVPVYLGDSMQWSRDASTVDDTTMRVEVDAHDLAGHETQVALFSAGRVLAFPLTSVDDPALFDRLVSDLAAHAQKHTNPSKRKPSILHLLNQYGISAPGDRELLVDTFSILADLNAAGENHVWGYFVRNQVRPLWFGLPHRHVQVLMGNPPWVAFKYMTEAMQRQFKRFSQARNLWTGGKVTVTQDLVGLFVARCVEQYLDEGGIFAFVAPKAVLSRMQYDGFRSGSWGSALASVVGNTTVSVRAAFNRPWDIGSIKPPMFPVPAAVVFGARSDSAGPMSSKTLVLKATLPARSVRLAVASELISFCEGMTTQHSFDGKYKSAYAPTVFQGAILSPRLVFFVQKRPVGPLGVSQGLVPVESYRTTLEREPWKSLPSLNGIVEEMFLKDVIMGGTLAPFRVLTPWRAVLPVLDDRLLTEAEIRNHRNLDAWWSKSNAIWEANKKPNSKLTLMDQLNYQGKLGRQLGKGTHRVVYVASGTSLAAAHVTDPNAIIDNSLYWMQVHDSMTAQYLVAILNSSTVLRLIRPLQSEGLFGPRHFHKLAWGLPIPLYDPTNELHRRLSALSREAEEVARQTELDDSIGFQAARKLVRRQLIQYGVEPQIDEAVSLLLNGGGRKDVR